MQEESSEDELPQFTPAGMRPLIDDTRLLERVEQAATKEDLTNRTKQRQPTTTTKKCSLEVLTPIKKTNKKHLNSVKK